MGSCEDLGRRLDALAVLDASAVPTWAAEHLAGCPGCARALMRARLARGLLAAAAGPHEPPADFAARVLAALPAAPVRAPADPDLWRSAWRLIPSFAAAALLVLILSQFDAGLDPGPTGPASGLAPVAVEALSSSEHLALGVSAPDLDLVLAAVMERDGR